MPRSQGRWARTWLPSSPSEGGRRQAEESPGPRGEKGPHCPGRSHREAGAGYSEGQCRRFWVRPVWLDGRSLGVEHTAV